MKYFEHNHIPKEVLLSLVVDEIEITKPNGDSLTLINNPLRPDHADFQKHLYKLISYGLGAYVVDTSQKIGPPLSVAHLKSTFGENAFEAMKESGIVLQKIGGPSELKFQPIMVSKNISFASIPINMKILFVRSMAMEYFAKKRLPKKLINQAPRKNLSPS